MIHIGIIETGHPADAIIERYGSYPHMFRDFFAGEHEMDFYSFSVLENEPLPPAKKCDGWLITGSKAAVYENHPWLPHLRDLILDTKSAKLPMLGICFGHQIMAQALGGAVEKSAKGRGIGIHQYELTKEGEKLAPGKKSLNLIAAHQDQVTKPPSGGRLLLTSAFCQYAGFAYGEWGMSLQGHPEFTPNYERALIKQWQENDPTDPMIVDAATKTLDTMQPDSKTLAPILGAFLARQTVI